MAGIAYGSFAVGDANLDNLMLQTAAVERGHCALTLTEMTTTTIPQIAEGSRIEINGTLFKFDANDSISGSATTGTNYIYITSAGVATWTTTDPTWFDSKQGWYDSTGSYRYASYIVSLSTVGSYYRKAAFDICNKGPAGVVFSFRATGNTGPITTQTAVTGLTRTGSGAAAIDYSDAPWGILSGGTSGYITIPFSGLYEIRISSFSNSTTVSGRAFARYNTALTGQIIAYCDSIYPGAAYAISGGVGQEFSGFFTKGDKIHVSGQISSGTVEVFVTVSKIA